LFHARLHACFNYVMNASCADGGSISRATLDVRVLHGLHERFTAAVIAGSIRSGRGAKKARERWA
jgi:hypothetical protein